GGVRRVLPVSRRAACRDRGRRHRGDPAGRLGERRQGDPGRRRQRRGDGVHRHAALPALATMRIVDIREQTVPVASAIANAYIDFSKMTLSHIAVITDVVGDGKPVVGYGFNSNGRYGQGGLIRERFAPRLLEAEPKALLDDTGDNFDPDRIWAVLMKNEKPGGHGERSVAVGTLDMAGGDAGGKVPGRGLFRLVAQRPAR